MVSLKLGFVFCLSFLVTNWVEATELCPEKFQNLTPPHTACLPPPPEGSLIPTAEGVDDEVIIEILRLHNYYRSNVQPPATNMQKMYWDPEIAMIAQKLASSCVWGHDKNAARSVPGRFPVGQNLAMGHRNFSRAIRAWYNEVNLYTFGDVSSKGYKGIGHYTQVVWHSSALVGCGYAHCGGRKRYYVCNYAPSGNYKGRAAFPYQNGTRASSCPNSADNGLCDCGGKYCALGGKLNIDTCDCECKYKRDWIRSYDCSVDCSKAVDKPVCGTHFTQKSCRAKNVPVNYCPIMCGLCPKV